MDKETAKAINNVSKRLNQVERLLDNIFHKRCNKNEKSIVEAEQIITDMDIAQIETEQQVTDLDIRVMELEG